MDITSAFLLSFALIVGVITLQVAFLFIFAKLILPKVLPGVADLLKSLFSRSDE